MRALARNWLFCLPIVVFAIYYAIQNIAGMYLLPTDLVLLFIGISAVGLLSYALAFWLVPEAWLGKIRLKQLSQGQVEFAALGVIVVYVGLLGLILATSDKAALIEVFRGASAQELQVLRETLVRTRSGAWQSLNYAYAIMSNALMPLAVTYAYHNRRAWRHIALAILIVGLSLTLAKGAIGSIAFPLLALLLMERRFRTAILPLVMLGAVIASMYFLSSGRFGALFESAAITTSTEQSAIAPIEVAPQIENVSSVPPAYNLLQRDDQISLAINRVVWIPYVTAIDWLRYQRDVLHGDFVLGRSIRAIAAAFGTEPLLVEREVATMQWGQNETGTASSNAIFLADAWVNFGWIGVILYAAVFAVTIKLLIATDSKPLIASAVVPVWTACFVALPPIYFSGGLAFLVFAALFSTRRFEPAAGEEARLASTAFGR